MRARVLRWVIAMTVVPVLCGAGILLYLNDRDNRQVGQEIGDATRVDRVDVQVGVQQVDAAGQRLVLRVLVVPRGSYAATDDDQAPRQDLVVRTTSLRTTTLTFPADQPIAAVDVPVGLAEGTISDYPFDRYTADVGFAVSVAGDPAPVLLSMGDIDPFFLVRPLSGEEHGGVAVLHEQVTRSRGTFLFSWFMMIAMWALALTVASAAWIVVAQRRGLIWPAMGWMAATLFALVGLRNAAPGSPPTGSVLDYAAFFWAELLIALSLCAMAVQGVRVERRTDPG